MNTIYRMKQTEAGELKPVSPWKNARFQRFFAITAGTALLLSLVATFTMKADVDNLQQEKIPYIQSQVDLLQAHLAPHA